MVRASLYIFAALFVMPAAASAQAPRFKWVDGQTLTYKVAQNTTATETVGDKVTETVTRLDLVKKWKISAVDTAGVATLTMSLEHLRMETKTPTGDKMLFDSSAPKTSTPALVDEMAKYVGVPLTVVRMDARGQIVEVKECKFGPASRLMADLPFKIALPATPLVIEAAWERSYQIKIEPAQGQPETYAATQRLTCKGLTGSLATIAVSTIVAGLPEATADQIPLCPLQPSGDVVFDLANGRLKSVRYKWTKELSGQQGEGSKYVFASTYVEEVQ